MATLTIRHIDDSIKARLRVRAARNSRSMEAEARDILLSALPPDEPKANLADIVREALGPLGGIDLDLDHLRKDPGRDPPTFD